MRRIIFVEGLHNVFFIVALVGLVFTLISLVFHGYSTFDFVISKIDRICQQPLNNRCEDHYLVREKNGSYEILIPFAYQFRESELVVGNSLKKNRFTFGYRVNDKKVEWEYPILHVLGVIVSCLILIWWQYLSRILDVYSKES